MERELISDESDCSKVLLYLDKLLELPEDIALVKPYTDELALIFAELTDVDAREQMLTKNNCHTSKCVAISPVQAAKCLQEPLRTQAFLKGIKQAILDRINKSSKQDVSILYAGTGPYSLLVSPLVALSHLKNWLLARMYWPL